MHPLQDGGDAEELERNGGSPDTAVQLVPAVGLEELVLRSEVNNSL